MAKIKTLSALQDHLDNEFAWRLKEISSLKAEVRSSKTISRTTLIRAGVTILYAHWEGFIKNASSHYLDFITGQSVPYGELRTCFVFLGLRGHLHSLSETGQVKGGKEAFEFIRSQMGERARVSHPKAINTESNLSSTVFDNIAESIALDISAYQPKYNLIDESLLRRRNRIAHGEYLDIEADEWRKLADEVLLMLRQFKTDIENAAVSAAYKRPAVGVVTSNPLDS